MSHGTAKIRTTVPSKSEVTVPATLFFEFRSGWDSKKGGGMHSVLIGPTTRLPHACIHSGILLSHPAHLGQIGAYGTKNPDSLGQHGTARVQ